MSDEKNFKITINDKDLYFSENDNGKTLLKFIQENEINIKSNCEGNCACGKCHVKFDEEHYNNMDIPEREQDVLDRKTNLTQTSRLACQVKLDKSLDNSIVNIMD